MAVGTPSTGRPRRCPQDSVACSTTGAPAVARVHRQSGYDIPNCARDLRELLTQLGIARAHVLNSSAGGLLRCSWAGLSGDDRSDLRIIPGAEPGLMTDAAAADTQRDARVEHPSEPSRLGRPGGCPPLVTPNGIPGSGYPQLFRTAGQPEVVGAELRPRFARRRQQGRIHPAHPFAGEAVAPNEGMDLSR